MFYGIWTVYGWYMDGIWMVYGCNDEICLERKGTGTRRLRQGKSVCLKKNAIVSGTQAVTWDIDSTRVAVLIL